MSERQRCKAVIKALVENLPEPQRTILALYYDEELLVAEIAHVMDLSVSQVTYELAKAVNSVFTCQNLLQKKDVAVH